MGLIRVLSVCGCIYSFVEIYSHVGMEKLFPLLIKKGFPHNQEK